MNIHALPHGMHPQGRGQRCMDAGPPRPDGAGLAPPRVSAAWAAVDGRRGRRCARLGIVLAQLGSYPQKKAQSGFCPRGPDSSARGRCTGLGPTQVRGRPGKKAVVHSQTRPLLLRLCIYRRHKKKTVGQLRGRLASALRPVVAPGAGWHGSVCRVRHGRAKKSSHRLQVLKQGCVRRGPIPGGAMAQKSSGRPPEGPQTADG